MNDPTWHTARFESDCAGDAIRQAYLAEQGRWTGCDWETAFGPRNLNLRGVRARQAALLGCALAGAEAQAWFEARDWLQSVERDAMNAELAASEAVMLAGLDDLRGAEESATRACQIAEKYQRREVWEGLLKAIQAAEQALRSAPSSWPSN